MKNCIIIIFYSPLLLLHAAFAQCKGTWEVPSTFRGSSYKDFGQCNGRGGPGKLVWKATGTGGKVLLSKAPYPGYREYETAFDNTQTGAYAIPKSGNYYVTFLCNNKCSVGRFQWHIVQCKCPNNWTVKTACVSSDVYNAKDVECEPPLVKKEFIFKFEIKDFEFEPINPTTITTEKISTSSNGIIKNCADGATTEHEVDMSLTLANSQSMTVSQSFTTSKTREVTAGISVTVEAKAGVIFSEMRVASTASFEYSQSWGESSTEEESKTMEMSSEIGFTLATRVTVQPNTCIVYTLSSNVSSEPVNVPYKAKTYLSVFHNDENPKQITDLGTLKAIQDNVLIGYESTIDSVDLSSPQIVYPIEGVFRGLYATKAYTETSNCDECGGGITITGSNSIPTDNGPSATTTTPSNNTNTVPTNDNDVTTTSASASSAVIYASSLKTGGVMLILLASLMDILL